MCFSSNSLPLPAEKTGDDLQELRDESAERDVRFLLPWSTEISKLFFKCCFFKIKDVAKISYVVQHANKGKDHIISPKQMIRTTKWQRQSVLEPTIVSRFGDELSTVHHSHVSIGSAGRIGLQSLDLLHHLKSGDDETKDNVDSEKQVFVDELLTGFIGMGPLWTKEMHPKVCQSAAKRAKIQFISCPGLISSNILIFFR